MIYITTLGYTLIKGGTQSQARIWLKLKQRGPKININIALLAITALFDIVGSSLMFIALTLVAASIYQMLRGFVMFMTAIQSIIILKRRYYRHHLLSLTFIIWGVGIVGISSILFPDKESEEETSKNYVLGVIIILLAQFFTAGLMIAEEKTLQKYYLHPLKVVGREGFWDFLFTSLS